MGWFQLTGRKSSCLPPRAIFGWAPYSRIDSVSRSGAAYNTVKYMSGGCIIPFRPCNRPARRTPRRMIWARDRPAVCLNGRVHHPSAAVADHPVSIACQSDAAIDSLGAGRIYRLDLGGHVSRDEPAGARTRATSGLNVRANNADPPRKTYVIGLR